jgi:hypothetical protein
MANVRLLCWFSRRRHLAACGLEGLELQEHKTPRVILVISLGEGLCLLAPEAGLL